jgi:hypothetical protein
MWDNALCDSFLMFASASQIAGLRVQVTDQCSDQSVSHSVLLMYITLIWYPSAVSHSQSYLSL